MSKEKNKKLTKMTPEEQVTMVAKLPLGIILKGIFKKFEKEVKFVLTGGFLTVLDFGIFNVLKLVVGLDELVANAISTTICVAVSFFINSRFVWKTSKGIRETAPGFLAVSFFSAWVVQALVIKCAFIVLGDGTWQSMVAKLCGSACGMISNYFGYKVIFLVDFKSRKK